MSLFSAHKKHASDDCCFNKHYNSNGGGKVCSCQNKQKTTTPITPTNLPQLFVNLAVLPFCLYAYLVLANSPPEVWTQHSCCIENNTSTVSSGTVYRTEN